MELFIRIANGVTVGNPIMGDNFREALPDIDVDNLPPEFARFVRVERPVLGEYQVFVQENPAHEFINGAWTDVWHVRDMTAEEKENLRQQEIAEYKTLWAALPQRDNFSTWIFNPETIKYDPPIERPTDREVVWHGASNAWVDKPQKPNDGKEYKIDFYTSSWVEVTP